MYNKIQSSVWFSGLLWKILWFIFVLSSRNFLPYNRKQEDSVSFLDRSFGSDKRIYEVKYLCRILVSQIEWRRNACNDLKNKHALCLWAFNFSFHTHAQLAVCYKNLIQNLILKKHIIFPTRWRNTKFRKKNPKLKPNPKITRWIDKNWNCLFSFCFFFSELEHGSPPVFPVSWSDVFRSSNVLRKKK